MRGFLISLFVISSFIVSCQVVKGKVVDAEGPLEFASIRIFKAKDSTVTHGIYTAMDGTFRLEDVNPGNYYVKISFSNFVTYIMIPRV